MSRAAGLLLLLICQLACGGGSAPRQISVAAASNLTDAFQETGREFSRLAGVQVVFNFASTAQLAHQVANGAPFDVFAAADVEHVEGLIRSGRIDRVGSGVFARGQLALWSPGDDRVRTLRDLLRPEVRYIAIARPASAPYGQAAIETLENAGLWELLEPKIVYASNINMAKQLAATGNAEAAFTSSSLVLDDPRAVLVDEGLHKPIDLAIGVVSGSRRHADAVRFAAFVLSQEGRAVLKRYGYR
jgi:molybdate transport system substrate-binding protein